MPSRFAFNWQPGVMEWILVVELVVLLTMALYRYVAALLGRSAPTDALVIFYRVFWRAMRWPRRYPIPVNYLPVPPRKPKPRLDDTLDVSGLTDEELEALMAGEIDPEAVTPAEEERAPPPPGSGLPAAAPSKDLMVFGGTRQVLVEVTMMTADAPGIRGLVGGRVEIGTNFPPDDGRANQAAIRQMCTLLRVQPHQIAIQSGHTKADKTLRVSGIDQETLAERLSILGHDSEEALGFRLG